MRTPLASHILWLDSQQSEMEERLKHWCSIQSGSFYRDGLTAMQEAYVDYAENCLGVKAEILPAEDFYQLNDAGEKVQRPLGNIVRLRKREDANKRVLLCGHMDTVFPAGDSFTSWEMIDEDTIRGPGVADMKGGLLVMIKALQAFDRSPLAQALGWEVLINADEEIGSPGSRAILHEAASRHHVGMVFEPAMADGSLAGGRKGSGNFSLLVRGKSAHAGREFHLGKNAIAALSMLMNQLHKLNNEDGDITLNLGRITGGGPVNVVPDLAICHFNIRVSTDSEQHFAEQWVKDALACLPDPEGYEIELSGGFSRPPKPVTAEQQYLFSLLAECGEALNLSTRFVNTGGCCDGNNLFKAGLPNIDTLGVRGGNIHSHQEYMMLSSLAERAKLSALFLDALAAGELPVKQGN